jgi:hypothetical protein
METKKLKRNLVISALMVVITSGGITRIPNLEQIRLVDFFLILVSGICIGVMIVNIGLYIRFKNKETK